MKKRIFILFISIIILTGCSEKAIDNGSVNVIFIPKVTGNAFFESANIGAEEYALRNGFQVTYIGNEIADISYQIEIIQEAIEDKADAICISSLDATALDDELKKAMKAGIPIVTWDSDVSGDARTIMVSQGTPEQLGQMLVEMGVKSLVARGINPVTDSVKYVWHYSQASVADQNSWYNAGEEYIKINYPNWINVEPDNYYSQQNPKLAVQVGEQILSDHPDIDLIICNDSTALPGQVQALKNNGLNASDLTVTGFSSPNPMKDYCREGIIARWGLWDCKIQGALGCYFAKYLAEGNNIRVGDRIDVPEIGIIEIMPNTVLDSEAYTADNSGVVLLPQRIEFNINNIDKFDF